jgi:membrane protease YdiL (CAAX protease family)
MVDLPAAPRSPAQKDHQRVRWWSLVIFVVVAPLIYWAIAWLLPPSMTLMAEAEFHVAALVAVFLVLVPLGRDVIRVLGLRWVGWRYVLGGAIGTVTLSFLLGLLELTSESAWELVRVIRQPGQLAVSLLLIGGLGSIAEEVVFRGLLYAWLEGRWGPRAAIVGSSLVFGIMHQEPALIATALPIGLFLGWLRWRSNSLIPSLVAHVTTNSAFVLVVKYYNF